MLNMKKKNYFTSTSYQLNIKLFVNVLSLHICYHLSKHDKEALLRKPLIFMKIMDFLLFLDNVSSIMF